MKLNAYWVLPVYPILKEVIEKNVWLYLASLDCKKGEYLNKSLWEADGGH